MNHAVDVSEVFRVFQTPEGDAPALQGVSLTVDRGEIVAVIGPSGSGKTTLLRILAGLERPDAGKAVVLGEEPARMSTRAAGAFRRGRIGLIEQHAEHSVSPDARCQDAVALQMQILGRSRADALHTAQGLLRRVGLGDLAGGWVRGLSGGQRQRVAAVAAMAHGPQLLLADEPTGELDAESAAAVHDVIRTLVAETGATAVVVSHDATVATIADRALMIADGRLATEQSTGTREPTLVVGPGGWVQLPAELRAQTGLGSRVTARPERDAIVLHRAGPAADAAPEAVVPGPPERTGGEIAALDRVSVSFGANPPLFPEISARFSAGSLTVVTGRSGAGKTTLLRLLAGLRAPTEGRCIVDGTDLGTLDADGLASLRRRSIAVVEQDVGLVPFLSARENLEFALTLRGLDLDRAEPWLLRLDLARRIDQRVGRLSAGERQRVALARAFAVAPRLLLIDEPSSRLDRTNARHVAHLISEVTVEQGACTVCSTHDATLIGLADGRIELGV